MSELSPIVFVAPWPWEALYNRSQPLALAFARRGHAVIYLQPREEAFREPQPENSPSIASFTPGPHPNLSLLEVRSFQRFPTAPLSSDFSPAAQAALKEAILEKLSGKKAILISSRPQLYSFFEYGCWSTIALDMEDPWLELNWGQHPYAIESIKNACRLADAAFANGLAIASFFEKETRRKVHSLPNGVEASTLKTLQASLPCPKQLNTGSALKRVCFLGKINDRIHFELLAKVLPQFTGIDFFFVGQAVVLDKDKPGWNALLAADNCHHTGLVPFEEVPAFLAHADALIIPYSEAGGAKMFPAKILEYVAAKKPIIASTIPPELSELQNAFYSYDSSDSLAETLDRLIADGFALTPELSAACETFAQNSTWDERAKTFLQLLPS